MDTNISVQKVDVLEEVSKEDVGSTTKQMDGPMIPLSDAELLRPRFNEVGHKMGRFKLLTFTLAGDYNFALLEGMWMVANHYLILQRWRPLFLMNVEKEKNVAIWIQIQRLPIELYNDVFLNKIGSSLGKFLKVDRLTSIHYRGKFARICVELDLEKPLEMHIYVRGHKLYLEYEGLHSICFWCGLVRHKKDQCREVVEVMSRFPLEKQVEDEVVVVEPLLETSLKERANINAIIANQPNIVTVNQDCTKIDNRFGVWMITQQNYRKGMLAVKKEEDSSNAKAGM
ncbi:hypothetical protein JHK82_031532 [Glycine max]|nr:hypothetical protein JHK82_031532 [Glycine max]